MNSAPEAGAVTMRKWLAKHFPGVNPARVDPRHRDDLNIYLSAALRQARDAAAVAFPVDYIAFLRDSLEPKACRVREIKPAPVPTGDLPANRFATVIDALTRLPPIAPAIAEKIGRIADTLRGNRLPVDTEHWAGDVGAHFEMSSSFATNGRILSAIIRFMRSTRCLELGTAYGMSALFMLEALAALGKDALLTTVEGSELQFALSSELLMRQYGERVSCVRGWTGKILPELVNSLDRVDFLFHDAGHSRTDYRRDFNAVLPVLAPGAVVLIDDIRWHDPRFCRGNPRCYAGWRDLVKHPRTRRAVEIGDGTASMGLLLLDG